jgi:hypothetical protein
MDGINVEQLAHANQVNSEESKQTFIAALLYLTFFLAAKQSECCDVAVLAQRTRS